MRFSKSLFLFSIVFFMILTSCKNNDSSNQSETKEQNDELILAIGGEPETGFDPTLGWGQYARPIFQSTLLKYDQDFNIKNDAATHYSISDDGITWTVKLRDSIQFSDGKPLTADDVVFTFQTAKNSASLVDLTNLDKVEKTDRLTVKFSLIKRDYTFIHHLLSLGIVPKHAYNATYSGNPIGSEPYQFVQWDKRATTYY